MDDVERVTHLIDVGYVLHLRRGRPCLDPYGVARTLGHEPAALQGRTDLTELVLTLVACVRGWSGLDQRPRNGDDPHEEALAVLHAIRLRVAEPDPSAIVAPALRLDAFDAALATPVFDLLFTGRLQDECDRRGVQTLHDLVCLGPEALLARPGIGRGIVSEAEGHIERRLATSWREARFMLLPDADASADPTGEDRWRRAARWTRFREHLPARVLSRSPGDLGLPKRVVAFARARRLETLRGIVELSLADLSALDGLGRATICRLERSLEQLFRDCRADNARSTSEDDHWLSVFRAKLESLDPFRRDVLGGRAGVRGSAEALGKMARRIGRSDDNARRLEAAALADLRAGTPALRVIATRLQSLLVSPFIRVDEVAARDPFFRVDEAAVITFAYFVERVLDIGKHVVRCERGIFISDVTRPRFVLRIAQAREAARLLQYPLARLDRDVALGAALGWEPVVAGAFASLLEHEWSHDGERLTAFGRTHRARARSRHGALKRATGRVVQAHSRAAPDARVDDAAPRRPGTDGVGRSRQAQ